MSKELEDYGKMLEGFGLNSDTIKVTVEALKPIPPISNPTGETYLAQRDAFKTKIDPKYYNAPRPKSV